MARPYAYLRKSVIRRDTRTLSPETQEAEVRRLAAYHNDNGERLLIEADWDISGRKQFTEKRPGFQRLLAAIRSGECSAVYSYSLSRISRSASVLSEFFDECQARGVPVRLVADSIDTSTASGRLMAGFLGAIAQFEADVAGERVSAMYERKRENGEEIRTRKRYGEHEGDDLQAVLDAYDEAGTYSGAARLLNERRVKPSSARSRRKALDGSDAPAAWWASSVGVVVQQARPELVGRQSRQGQRSGDFMLAKLLRCGTCGSMLTGSRLPLRSGLRYVRYACRFAESSPHERVTVTEKQLLPWIMAEAARLRIDATDVEMEKANEERNRLEAQRKAIGDALVDGLYTRAQARDRAAAIDARLAALNRTTTTAPIPEQIDWSWPTSTINGILRAMWQEVRLGTDLRPVKAEWWVPEWRA